MAGTNDDAMDSATPGNHAAMGTAAADTGAGIGAGAGAAGPAPEQTTPLPLEFTGAGGEYFRIWIVNWALSIVTLGLYSPWAKVRRERYFHQNAWLARSNFEYTGNPLSILKGRLLVAGLVVAWQVSQRIEPMLAALFFIAGLIAFPWLVVAALRFRMHNTRYRGLRFRFHGQAGGAFKTYLLWGSFNLGWFYPSFVLRKARYLFGNTAFGTTRFVFSATSGPFYRLYYSVALVAFICAAVAAVIVVEPLRHIALGGRGGMEAALRAAILMVPFVAVGVIVVRVVLGYVDARKFRICWNATTIGRHRMQCDLSVWRYAWVAAYGMLFTLLTLTLYKPWMDVALARLRLGSLTLIPGEDLGRMLADTEADRAATGDEAADLLGFDIGV